MESITLKDILYVLGAITTIVTFIIFVSKPYKEIHKKLDKHDLIVEDLSETRKVQQKLLNSSFKVQMLIMQHVIYCNHVDVIKQELSNLQNDIIDAKQ